MASPRKSNIEEFKQSLEKRNKQNAVKRAELIDDSVTKAREAKFLLIYGSNVQPKWYEWLMTHGSRFMFTLVLVGFIINLAISIYKFVKEPNKNINQTASLAWNAAKVGIVVGAILISLLAAPALAVVTAGLMVGSLAADTLVNIGLFFWNTFKLAHLRFTLRKRLNDPKESPLTRLKYEALKKKYLDEIKGTALASVIGLIMTAATAVIFLFPHVGLAAIASTPIAVGAVKLTVAGIAGISAVAAVVVPVVVQLGAKLISKISEKISPSIKTGLSQFSALVKSGFSNFVSLFKAPAKQNVTVNQVLSHSAKEDVQVESVNITTEKAEEVHVQKEQQVEVEKASVKNEEISVASAIEESPSFVQINSQPKKFEISHHNYEESINHTLGTNTFTKHSQMRELIIEHIHDPSVAKKAMIKMVEDKIDSLTKNMGEASQHKHSNMFSEKERANQEQKLHALIMIKTHLNIKEYVEGDQKYKIFLEQYKKYFHHPNLLHPVNYFEAFNLLRHIEKTLPGVKQSFFQEQSDTQNLIDAFRFYVHKFPENEPGYEPYVEKEFNFPT